MTALQTPEPIRPRAEDTDSAVRAWMTYELTQGTARSYDLGKFLFTVSLGTAGLVASLIKDIPHPIVAILSILASVLSACVALALAWPQTWSIGGHTDLLARYTAAMAKTLMHLKLWVIAYAGAFGLSVYAILSRT
ncbi:MAG: hypothetical protein ACMG6S_04225 [Byssovorax sp.]